MNFLKLHRNLAWFLISAIMALPVMAEDRSVVIHGDEVNFILSEKSEFQNLHLVNLETLQENPAKFSRQENKFFSNEAKKEEISMVGFSIYEYRDEKICKDGNSYFAESLSNNFSNRKIKGDSYRIGDFNLFEIFDDSIVRTSGKTTKFLNFYHTGSQDQKIANFAKYETALACYLGLYRIKQMQFAEKSTVQFISQNKINLPSGQNAGESHVRDIELSNSIFHLAQKIDYSMALSSYYFSLFGHKAKNKTEKFMTLLQKPLSGLFSTLVNGDFIGFLKHRFSKKILFAGVPFIGKNIFSDYAYEALCRNMDIGKSNLDFKESGLLFKIRFADRLNFKECVRVKSLSFVSAYFEKSFGCAKRHFNSNGKIWGDLQPLLANC